METNPKVYGAIAAVMQEMSQVGISKDRRNQQQGYNFRGIDDAYAALSPVLAKNRLLMLPRVTNREQVERVSSKGGAIFYTTVTVEFDLVSADDGSKHTIVTVGEAMDSADKSSNKAMSAAYKYAAFQAFCIPTEGDNDADGSSHDVAARNGSTGQREMTSAALAIEEQMKGAKTVPELVEIMNSLSKEQKAAANAVFNQRMKELKKAA
ncbi:TPA: ERF family protein [Burkholderia vietnamiensis]|nr:ERF family protein [Burkholderia vietnamiensis]